MEVDNFYTTAFRAKVLAYSYIENGTLNRVFKCMRKF